MHPRAAAGVRPLRRDNSGRGERVVRCPTEAVPRRPTSTSGGSTCASSGPCNRPAVSGPTVECVGIAAARSERARERKHSCRTRAAHAWIAGSSHATSRRLTATSMNRRAASACSRPGCGRRANHAPVAAAAPPRQASTVGSGSPATMASDTWIAGTMRQSDAETETIAARPLRKRRPSPVERRRGVRAAHTRSAEEDGGTFGPNFRITRVWTCCTSLSFGAGCFLFAQPSGFQCQRRYRLARIRCVRRIAHPGRVLVSLSIVPASLRRAGSREPPMPIRSAFAELSISGVVARLRA